MTAVVAVVVSVTPKDFLVREMVADRSEARRLLSTALLTRFSAIPLVFVGATLNGHIADLDGHAMVVMYCVAGAAACLMVLEPALSVFQSTQHMQYIAYTDIGNKTVVSPGGVLLAPGGFGVVAIAGFGLRGRADLRTRSRS